MFHTFPSQEARRAFGGSDFIEMQYCKLGKDCEIGTIVSVNMIPHWQTDSLYLFGNDMTTFETHYGKIFTGGIYNNGNRGPVDLCGINFYSQKQLIQMVDRIRKDKPLDYQTLLNWLEAGKQYIGFYLLGV